MASFSQDMKVSGLASESDKFFKDAELDRTACFIFVPLFENLGRRTLSLDGTFLPEVSFPCLAKNFGYDKSSFSSSSLVPEKELMFYFFLLPD